VGLSGGWSRQTLNADPPLVAGAPMWSDPDCSGSDSDFSDSDSDYSDSDSDCSDSDSDYTDSDSDCSDGVSAP
jgi:hypothetical protein